MTPDWDARARAMLTALTRGHDPLMMRVHLYPDKTGEIVNVLSAALRAAYRDGLAAQPPCPREHAGLEKVIQKLGLRQTPLLPDPELGQDVALLAHIIDGIPDAVKQARAEAYRDGLKRAAEIRPVVLAFALAMERKLRAHDDRPGWKDEPNDYLIARLREEMVELAAALDRGRHVPLDIVGEAADVANFAMMIADNSGLLAAAIEREAGQP